MDIRSVHVPLWLSDVHYRPLPSPDRVWGLTMTAIQDSRHTHHIPIWTWHKHNGWTGLWSNHMRKKIKNSNPVWVGLSSIFPQGRWLLQGVFTQTSLSLMGEAAPQQSWSVCSTSDSCTDTVGLKHQRLSYCWRPGSCCSLTLADKWGHSVRNWCWRGFLKRFTTVCYNMPLPQSVERHGHNCYLLPQFVV